MSQSSNGITPEVIRQIMPPYQLSPDLLQATLAALPRPPQDATTAWRHAHIERLTQEISALMPANAAQARIAAQILISRELADSVAAQAHAPGLEIPLLCRLARTAAALMQTAAMLERSLTRHHQKPAPFFGTALSDAVDIPALDAAWRSNPHQPQTAPDAAPPPMPRPPDLPNQPPNQPSAAPPAADANPPPPPQPTPPSAVLTPTAPQPQPQPDRPPHPPTHPEQPDATTPEWSITKLDEGPGWSREILRHRSSREGGNGSTP